MNLSDNRLFSWRRLCLHAGFVLVLLSAVLARAVATPAEGVHGKALGHAVAEFKVASNGLSSDPPESKSALPVAAAVSQLPLPRVLGQVHSLQFSPMVHQLRDRLMHAPPAAL